MEDICKALKMDMGNCITKVEIFIKASLLRIRKMGMEKCFGRIVVSIKESGEMEFRMAKVKCI